MASTADVQEGLRYTYGENRLLYLRNKEVALYNYLKTEAEPVGGRGQFIMPILTANAGNFRGNTEGGTRATPLQPATTEALWNLQEYDGVFDLTWKLIQDAMKSEWAFQRAMEMAEDSYVRRMLRVINADLLSNSTGNLGTLPAADDATTVTLTGAPRMEIGQSVDLMDVSGATGATVTGSPFTVVDVDPVGNTVTLNAAPTGSAAGDFFTLAGTITASVSNHMNGLLSAISDANPPAPKPFYGSIDRTAAGNSFWQSVVLQGTPPGTLRPLTEDLMTQGEDFVRLKGGGRVNVWWMNTPIMRRYHDILRADTFFALGSVRPFDQGAGVGREGGTQGAGAGNINNTNSVSDSQGRSIYRLSGVTVHVDPYFEPFTVVGFDREHFLIGHGGDNATPRPVSEIFDGAPTLWQTPQTRFEVPFYWQGELVSRNPAAGVVIEDIAET